MTGQLEVVVLGDSVMWGDGLKSEQKFVSLFGNDLAKMTNRTVHVESFAHSGARLQKIDDMNSVMHEINLVPQGDLDSQRPTTEEQESCAAQARPDAEVVLLDGCINDVGATKIALPAPFNFTKKTEIAAKSQQCGPQMQKLVQRATMDFPKATIVVMNYYRIVSDLSRPEFKVTPSLSSTSTGTSEADAMELDQVRQMLKGNLAPGGTAAMDLKRGTAKNDAQADAILQSWSDNSDAFLATSQDCFSKAVNDTNGVTGRKCYKEYPPPLHDPVVPTAAGATKLSRVYLVAVPDRPEFAYGASNAHIWRLPSASHPDEMYRERKSICDQVFHDALSRYKCSINATAHPNVQGAEAYRDSLVSLFKVAWKTF